MSAGAAKIIVLGALLAWGMHEGWEHIEYLWALFVLACFLVYEGRPEIRSDSTRSEKGEK